MSSISKTEFRRQVRQISVAEIVQRLDSAWGKSLFDWLKGQSGIWGGYIPLGDELPITTLISRLPNLTWVFPRVLSAGDVRPEQEGLVFHQVAVQDARFERGLQPNLSMKSGIGISETGDWVQGRYTVEPRADAPIVTGDQIQGLLIPGLAFDLQGHRLGRGGGYYDRFLSSFKGVKIGIIASNRFLTSVPVEPHDSRVDAVATESNLVWFK